MGITVQRPERRVEIRQKQLGYAQLMREAGQMNTADLLSAEQALSEAKIELHSRRDAQ